jgi:soluble lytic murein transglycosylase
MKTLIQIPKDKQIMVLPNLKLNSFSALFRSRFLLKCQGTILSGAIVMLSLGSFAGQTPYQIPGQTLNLNSYIDLEIKVFQRIQEDQIDSNLVYEKEIESKILDVIAEYDTGLHEDYIIKVPGWIVAESKRYGYDPMFITALIITESSFNNWAYSHKGAVGLMQIKPKTGAALALEVDLEWKGTPTLFDPGSNIALGAYYLNKMFVKFGDLQLALEAYNHGPTGLNRILKKGRTPKIYSTKVLSNYNKIIATNSTI